MTPGGFLFLAISLSCKRLGWLSPLELESISVPVYCDSPALEEKIMNFSNILGAAKSSFNKSSTALKATGIAAALLASHDFPKR